jgi:DnaJ-domain-containing protein 1
MNWSRWLGKAVRLGADRAPLVKRAAGKAVEVAEETREAFGRGLRGEPEPEPRAVGPAATPEQVTAWYANLEIDAGSDLEAVHQGWKRLQRRYHPDLHAADPVRTAKATDLIQELNAAYRNLRQHLER